ncbi:MAG: hypothetical protein GEV08_18610 [Acidimicrobiia bacterium]|nr:hypothetical protein [Acidimicrobiia bacterium]
MWLRLRQIALVASDIEEVVGDLTAVLGIEVAFVDPGVKVFGLENRLLPIGNQLLEVVAPIQEGTTGGRYLERRGGDGGYMIITQTDDHAPRRARVEALGVRIAHSFEDGGLRNMQLHPKDTGGSFFEIDMVTIPGGEAPDGPWPPAGRDWASHRRTEVVSAIAAAELQCDDPLDVARRWGAIAELPVEAGGAGASIRLENATLRFVPITDGRPEGLGGIDVTVVDRDRALAAAEERGLAVSGDRLDIAGMRVKLV